MQTVVTIDLPSEPGRALIALPGPVNDAVPAHVYQRPDAAFLAQLIATVRQFPQTRARRRAEPDAASDVYAAAGDDQRTARSGRSISMLR